MNCLSNPSPPTRTRRGRCGTSRTSPSWPTPSRPTVFSSRSWCVHSRAATSSSPASAGSGPHRWRGWRRCRHWSGTLRTSRSSNGPSSRTSTGGTSTPIERAKAYQRYLGAFSLTQAEAAERLGEDRSVIANYLRLLDLPDEIRQMLVDGRLTMGHARAILSLPTDELRRKLANRALAGRLSVREVERLVRKHLEEDPAAKPKVADEGTSHRGFGGEIASPPWCTRHDRNPEKWPARPDLHRLRLPR